MTVLTAHQSAYWPWAGYLAKISQADVFVLMDSVQYSTNSFDNRNRIKGVNGPIWLTVPILHKGNSHTPINETQIDNTKNWRKKHYQAIKQSYSKCPYYKRYEPFLTDLYIHEWDNLSKLNMHILEWILDELNITTKIIKMSDHNFQGTKSDLILDMCIQLQADHFIFGVNGKDYVKPVDFQRAGVSIEFQNYIPKHYVQAHGDFIPRLSTLDILMHKGPNSMEVIRG